MVAKAQGPCNRFRRCGLVRPSTSHAGEFVALVGASRQNAAMSHDSTFPDSPEAPERRTDRVLAQLQYEERAGLGFRRRQRRPMGNPYAEPERYQVTHEPTPGELWAGMLAGLGAVLAVGAIFYKPLLFATLAAILTVLGSLGDGQASRIARWGIVLTAVGATLGMLNAIFLTKAPLF